MHNLKVDIPDQQLLGSSLMQAASPTSGVSGLSPHIREKIAWKRERRKLSSKQLNLNKIPTDHPEDRGLLSKFNYPVKPFIPKSIMVNNNPDKLLINSHSPYLNTNLLEAPTKRRKKKRVRVQAPSDSVSHLEPEYQ